MSYGKGNKTPAPDRVSVTNLAGSQKIAADSYGDSGFSVASSDLPGSRTISKLAQNIEQTNRDSVLAGVLARGTAKVAADWQTRTVSAAPPKPAGNMHVNTGSPSGKVAAGLDPTPARKLTPGG